jgi:membrane-associated protein
LGILERRSPISWKIGAAALFAASCARCSASGGEHLMELIQQLRHYLQHIDEPINQLASWNMPVFYLVLFLIVFAETGLVVTPFLPGDSLLFALGAVIAAGSPLSLPLLIGLLIAAAVLGDAVNYAIGFRLGPKVFKYESSWLLNKKHLLRAQAFYEKYGSKTIILARFVPIVRTFAPFVAGIGKMNYSRFGFYNVLGGIAWVLICVISGYFFGGIPWVKDHFEAVVVAIIAVSVMPMVVEFILEWRRHARARRESAAGTQPSEAA